MQKIDIIEKNIIRDDLKGRWEKGMRGRIEDKAMESILGWGNSILEL